MKEAHAAFCVYGRSVRMFFLVEWSDVSQWFSLKCSFFFEKTEPSEGVLFIVAGKFSKFQMAKKMAKLLNLVST